MLEIYAENGKLVIKLPYPQSEEEAINDLYVMVCSILIHLSEQNAFNKESACLNYGTYAKVFTELVEYSLTTVDRFFNDLP